MVGIAEDQNVTVLEDGNTTIFNENSSADYAFASFSGYVGLYGEMAIQFGGTPGKIFGITFSITNGIISGSINFGLALSFFGSILLIINSN